MQNQATYSKQFVFAVKLARLAASATGSEAEAASAKLAAYCQANNLSLAEIVDRAARLDTKTDDASKAGSPKPETAKPKRERKADAKPEADTKADAAQTDRATARAVAGAAVAAFYAGASLPFKAATVKLSPLNPANAKPFNASKPRQPALLACLLAYGRGTIDKRGEFVRNTFRVPASLIDSKAPASLTIAAQPESGCVSDQFGRTIHHVSGALHAPDVRLRIDFEAALREISQAFGAAHPVTVEARRNVEALKAA